MLSHRTTDLEAIALQTAETCRHVGQEATIRPFVANLAISNMVTVSKAVAGMPAAFGELSPGLQHELVDLALDVQQLTGVAPITDNSGFDAASRGALFVESALDDLQANLNKTDLDRITGSDPVKQQAVGALIVRCGSGFEQIVQEITGLGQPNQVLAAQYDAYATNAQQATAAYKRQS